MDEQLFFRDSHFGDVLIEGQLPEKGVIYSKKCNFGSIHYRIEENAICVTHSTLCQSGFIDFPVDKIITIPKSINGIPVKKYRGEVTPGYLFFEGGDLSEIELFIDTFCYEKYGCEYDEDKKVYRYHNAVICRVDGSAKNVVTTIVHCERHLIFNVPGKTVIIDSPYATPVVDDRRFETNRFIFSGEVVPYLDYDAWYDWVKEYTDFFAERKNLIQVNGILRGKKSWSFRNCGNISEIHFGNGMKEIEPRCFAGCFSLKDFYVPDSVNSIGESTFEGCSQLESVHIPKSLDELPERLFFGCHRLSKCFIPDGVRRIGKETFRDCKAIVKIWLPDRLMEIEDGAFRGCSSLKAVVIPPSVMRIGKKAFDECPHILIKGYRGTEAERYAKEELIPFSYL